MKITIEIPKEFESHWRRDRFYDSLSRLKADADGYMSHGICLSGNYEAELVDMLISAFIDAKEE